MINFLAAFRRPTLLLSTIFAVLLNCATWLFVSNQVQPSSDVVPLHYNIYFGIDLLGPWWYVLLFPAVGTVTCVANAFLAALLMRRDTVAAHFVAIANPAIQLFLLLGSYFSLTQLMNP